MSIIRNTPNFLKHLGLGFTTIINSTMDLIQDPATLGIYCYLAGKQDNWEINETNLQNRFNKGRDFIRDRLAELKKIGLIKTQAFKDSKGRITHWETTLINYLDDYENHNTENPESGIKSPVHITEIPVTGESRHLEKPTHSNNIYIPIKETSTNNADSKKSAIKRPLKEYQKDSRFMRFYSIYPNKQKPFDAWKAFKSIVGNDNELLEFVIKDVEERKKRHSQWQNGKQFIIYPAAYLRSGTFDGEIVNEKEQSQAQAQQERIKKIEREKSDKEAENQRALESQRRADLERQSKPNQEKQRTGSARKLSELLKGTPRNALASQ
jgi:hypothetical protein